MSIERKFKMALDETRLLMLGAQILFGFQFNDVFHEGFEDLPQSSRWIDALALMLIAVSIALLIAPSAQHRLTDDGQITGRLSSGDVYVAVSRIANAAAIGAVAAALSLILFLTFWYVQPLILRGPG